MFLEFYGLKEQPFGATLDPRFIYRSKTHSKAFNSLSCGIEAGCGFQALIAEPGMGKTTLVFQLLQQLKQASRSVFLFQTQCDSRELLRYLLSGLGIDATGQDIVTMHERLNQLLARELLAGRCFVLIIDECQNLDNSMLETVRLLSDFETPETKLIQIILVGQTQLADKLLSPSLAQLRQRISILTRLEPLTWAETVWYIEHRLQVAGYVGPLLFTPEALEEIWEHCEGTPRSINNLCFHALLAGYQVGRKKIDSAIIDQVIANLEMNLLEPQRAVTQGEPPALTSPRTVGPGFGLSVPYPDTQKTDPRRSDFAEAEKVVAEFQTTPSGPVPQTPQAQTPQRARASPADVTADDFSHSKVDSENAHKRVSDFGAGPPARKPSVTQTNPSTPGGDFSGRKQNPSGRVGLSYPVPSRAGPGRRVWGIATVAAALSLAGLFLFHSRVGASRRSEGPPSAAALPLTPQPTPEASGRLAGASTRPATSPLATGAPVAQSFPTDTPHASSAAIVIDPEHGGHDTGAAESTTRVEGTQERDANTEFALGVRYALGTGVARNDKQAFRLFKRAGERGNVSAQSSLAMSYWLGRGIRQNNVEAYSWATIAYERGDPPSGELLKVLVGMMSQTELTEGTRKAQEWQRRHSAR